MNEAEAIKARNALQDRFDRCEGSKKSVLMPHHGKHWWMYELAVGMDIGLSPINEECVYCHKVRRRAK
jgi:hypothetical protein